MLFDVHRWSTLSDDLPRSVICVLCSGPTVWGAQERCSNEILRRTRAPPRSSPSAGPHRERSSGLKNRSIQRETLHNTDRLQMKSASTIVQLALKCMHKNMQQQLALKCMHKNMQQQLALKCMHRNMQQQLALKCMHRNMQQQLALKCMHKNMQQQLALKCMHKNMQQQLALKCMHRNMQQQR